MFLCKYDEYFFFCVCGNKILTEGVIVTQLSTNAEISVWQLCGLQQVAVSWEIYEKMNLTSC